MNPHSETLHVGSAAATAPQARTGQLSVQTIAGEQWDALLGDFEDITLDQYARYEIHRWGADKVMCLAVRDGDGEIVGGAACLKFTLPVLGGILFVRCGPVWRRSGAAENQHLYASIVKAIRDYSADSGMAIVVIPRTHPEFVQREVEALYKLGFVHTLNIDDDRYMVDCSLPAEEQLASLAQTWRANLRRAHKAGVEVVELDASNYSEFEALYERMMSRKRVKLYDPVEVAPKLQHLKDPPRTLMARHNGEAVAGIVYAIAGDIAYYLYGATNDNALPVRAGYALQWAVLDRLRGHVRWYDLGGAPTTGRSLHQFKAGLVGKTGRIVEIPGEFTYAPNLRTKLAVFVIIGIRQTRRLARDLVQSIRHKVT